MERLPQLILDKGRQMMILFLLQYYRLRWLGHVERIGTGGSTITTITATIKSTAEHGSPPSRGGFAMLTTLCRRVGIPQGSSLGNTLFLTFINDLSHFITEGLVVLFADDTTVILCARTYGELNTKITCTYNKLQEWFSLNGLILNASKSNLILFSAKSIEKPLSINSPVPICPSCKFLGFTLDPNLNWKIHVQTLCDRLTGAAYALRKLRPVVSSSVLKQTYFAHFQSLMSYGILLWGTSVDSERVFVLQKRAIRIMADIGPRETCRTRFSMFRVMTMTNLYLFELLSYVRRNIASFSRRSAGNRLLRNTGRLATVRRRTEIATKNPRRSSKQMLSSWQLSLLVSRIELRVHQLIALQQANTFVPAAKLACQPDNAAAASICIAAAKK
ncbi:reverse transcriptase (RNA-dependent DNA polymerase) domain-containing protein [Phthorimaea operculella]|nr:reverse transcriptase (RNA-dependent DNA polymerase) domain-containing protein [Phthorimaea operculella]